MKQHTQRFKEAITELGKQQSVLITYTIDNEEVILGVEEINSATPRYDADLLKSVMKELHLDSNVDIPVGTEINFKYGLLVDGEFEYLDYGNYIVYTSEKKEDTSSYEILCYDKMLYAMKEYEELNITYPCTVIQYINAIATKMGLKVSSNNNKFPNYNTEITGEFYLSIDEETKERTSLGYTYRDILDDLAEVTASVIFINEYDELEVRDIKDAINYETTEKSKELKIESQLEAPIQLVTLDGASTQETREGYNLVDFSSKGDFENDVLTVNGTVAWGGLDFYILDIIKNNAGKKLYFSCESFDFSNANNGMVQINYTQDETHKYFAVLSNDGKFTPFQIPNDVSTITNAVIRIYFNNRSETGTTYTTTITKPMLALTENLPYEPYGASPSPEFPSEIQSVGDDVNLMPFSDKSFTLNNIEYTCENGSLYLNGTSKLETSSSNNLFKTNFAMSLKAGTYTFSHKTGIIASRIKKVSDDTDLAILGRDTSSITFTLNEDTECHLGFYVYQNSFDNQNLYLKLQKGTVATAYSEYGKGTVEIKQTGINLLDMSNAKGGTNNGITCEINEDGSYSYVGTATQTAINVWLLGGYGNSASTIFTLKAGTYYIKDVRLFNKTTGLNGTDDTSSVIVTFENDVEVTGVRAKQAVTGQTYNEKLYPIIAKSDVPVEWEQYKGNNYVIPTTPLRSLPNGVKDTIEEDGIHRRVGSVVLDGTQDIFYSVIQGDYFLVQIPISDKISSSNNMLSNYFPNKINWGDNITNESVYVGGSIRALQFKILSTRLSTVDNNGFKEWLSTHNTEVLYELAEEIIEPLNEEQQAVIDSIETFEGVNIISSNAELQIRYAIDQDTIDEEYLKDTNVNFGEVFGPVNAVVLSRSSSDNIYRNDVASINQNGLYEIKISDNQIMNQNNRDTFIQAIFDKLKGLTYGICDFSSTGIMYYDLLDRFNVKVGDNTYSIVMFHDEQNITQGLEENIFAEKPERSETDYTKADKTDQKLNQTNLIVDKQNQQISALVSSNTNLEQKTAQLIIDVEGIKGQISDVADVTTTAEGYGTAELDNISGDSEPIYLKVYPVNEDIIALKPQTDLYPRIDLYPHSREVYFKNTSSQEPYEVVFNIPTDLYQLDGVYDECILSYEAKECYVIHRIGINANGEKYLLETETIERFDYPSLPLAEGDYQVYTPAFNMAYIYVRLMSKNIYTEQFATKVELNSKIEQTATDITTSVNKTLTNYDTKTEVNSKIAQTATEINSEVSKKVGNDEIISRINQSAEQVQINANKISLARKNS